MSDFLRELYAKLPVNARLLLESAIGKQDQITNKDFSPEDLAEISRRINAWKESNTNIYNNELQDLGDQVGQGNFTSNPDALVKRSQSIYNRFGNPNRIVSNYEYPKGHNKSVDKQNLIQAAYRSIIDPKFRIDTSLGRFVAHDQGDHYQLEDYYGWQGDDVPWDKVSVTEMLSKPTIGLNYIAEKLFPKVVRGVNVQVPKLKKNE